MLDSLKVIIFETPLSISTSDKKLISFILSTIFEYIFKYITLSTLGIKSDLVYVLFIIPFEKPNNFLKFSSKTIVNPSSKIIRILYRLTSVTIFILSSLKSYFSFNSKLIMLFISFTSYAPLKI